MMISMEIKLKHTRQIHKSTSFAAIVNSFVPIATAALP